ncbi:MAG TPA: hypothetical protein VF320_04895 [Acidimicrobiales bacterium]
MFVALWSVKGGSGTSVVSAALALVLARRSVEGALLVDLAGDLPAVLGLPEPSGPGLGGWFAAGPDVPQDGLSRLEVPAADGLTLIPRGSGALGPFDRAEALAAGLALESRSVVIDGGLIDPAQPAGDGAASALIAGAEQSLLVTRPCYLALRRAVSSPLRPTGVVLVTEPGRALGRRDVEQVIGVDVVAEVPVDAAVSRAVDAGLLSGRLPASLARALGRAS